MLKATQAARARAAAKKARELVRRKSALETSRIRAAAARSGNGQQGAETAADTSRSLSPIDVNKLKTMNHG